MIPTLNPFVYHLAYFLKAILLSDYKEYYYIIYVKIIIKTISTL